MLKGVVVTIPPYFFLYIYTWYGRTHNNVVSNKQLFDKQQLLHFIMKYIANIKGIDRQTRQRTYVQKGKTLKWHLKNV